MNPSILPYGDQAILIEFENKIDPKINGYVYQLNALIAQKIERGITYTIPSYCSLVVGYDVQIFTLTELQKNIRNLLINLNHNNNQTQKVIREIPVCYDKEYGIDNEEICNSLEIDQDELISLHTSIPYMVYMIGFQPGFPYMGKLNPKLKIARKDNPRIMVHERSIAIAGDQTGIYPQASPGGWHIIGRTPLPLYQINDQIHFLCKAGEWIQFKSISQKEYKAILFEKNVKDYD